MKIGIVGYQQSGKSLLFEWLTGETANPAMAHLSQSAMAAVPEPRVAGLCEIYKPKKVTLASIEVVDTPGLSRTHEGSAQKLAMIREAASLVVVVAGFGGNDPLADLRNLDADLLIADLDIVSNRVERLKEQVKKPRGNREELEKELVALVPILARLDAGETLHDLTLTPDQEKAIRSFQLFTNKPRLVIVNTADDETNPVRFVQNAPPDVEMVAVPLSLERDLAGMTEAERTAFCQEMGVQSFDRDGLLRKIMLVSGQMLFFTAGEKEVRTWLIRQNCTAVEAAGGIHTDLAKGFIRAETMTCADLFRVGSEREIKAHNLLRHEPRDYVIQDGDILLIRHN